MRGCCLPNRYESALAKQKHDKYVFLPKRKEARKTLVLEVDIPHKIPGSSFEEFTLEENYVAVQSE